MQYRIYSFVSYFMGRWHVVFLGVLWFTKLAFIPSCSFYLALSVDQDDPQPEGLHFDRKLDEAPSGGQMQIVEEAGVDYDHLCAGSTELHGQDQIGQ